MTRIEKWSPITQLDRAVEEMLRGDLAAVDALHRSWIQFTASLDEADRYTLRRRTLRKHAIETGIIERLYEIDWGVTEQLVAEGLTREAVARAGGEVSPRVLAMLEAQFDGLELVTEYVRDYQPLTTSFIKELHALITRAQIDYEATDTLGRRVRAKLNHGSFKTLPNNVKLADGSLREFAPAEQVDGEIERLVEWYNEMDDVHAVVSAAWLHHRFVQIHPFQDGNGRVARALTLLSLEQNLYPPLVVDRDSRSRYIESLDLANAGSLAPLGRLFTKLAMRSIRRELVVPIPAPIPRTARDVARAFARSFEQKRREEAESKQLAVRIRASQLHGNIGVWFDNARQDLKEDFAQEGLTIRIWKDEATPEEPPRRTGERSPSQWFDDQIIESAKRAEHFAVLWADRWWTMLGIAVNGLQLRFVASMHHVGSLRTGVMAITSFGEIRIVDEGPSTRMDAFIPTSWDAFTFSHDEEVEDRAAELYEWLDQSLAVALQKLMNRTVALVTSPDIARPPPNASSGDWIQTVTRATRMAMRNDGWAYLADVGNYIRLLDPAFDASDFGHEKLSLLIESRPDLLETRKETKTADGPTHIYVRLLSGA